MTFGLTRGEIILVAFIFALVYGAGLLPKLAARLSRGSGGSGGAGESGVGGGSRPTSSGE